MVILSFGSTETLRTCIDALRNNSYPNIEVLIGRFGSQNPMDDLASGIQFPLTVSEFGEDIGVAAARNQLCMNSNGEYVAFLDDDTIPTPQWLNEAIDALSRGEGVGAVQSLLLDASDPRIVDGAGSLIDISGYPLERGRLLGVFEGKDAQYVAETSLFGACSAAMIVKKSVFEQVGNFDPDFVIEMEDLDLSWRIRLAGYSILLANKSKVLHKRQSKSMPRSRQYQSYRAFHGLKNQILCIAKNMGSETIIKFLPVILAAHVVKLFMPRGRVSFLMARAVVWNLRNLRDTLRKRYRIQHMLRRRAEVDTLAQVVRLPILLAHILLGTRATLRIVRSLDERQLC